AGPRRGGGAVGCGVPGGAGPAARSAVGPFDPDGTPAPGRLSGPPSVRNIDHFDMKPRPLAVRPEELRAIRRAFCPHHLGDRSGGSRMARGRGAAEGRPVHRPGLLLISTPPTGATSRRRPPRGTFLIPRPLAVELHLRAERA